MSIRIGIVGCGGIARSHAAGYHQQGAVIVGVTDPDAEAARRFGDEVGGAQVCADCRELIERASPDAISICSPPAAHEEAAVHALRHGVHVLCEKPMAFDVASAYRIRDALQGSDAVFMPAFRHRFLPANVFLCELVKSGDLGDPVFFHNIFCGPAFHMEGRWFTKRSVAGGGCVLDTNSHSVDLFRFIMGEITDQKAVLHKHFKTTDVEDAGILCVKSVGGALGSLGSSFVAGTGLAFIDIVGTNGRAIFDYMDGGQVRYKTAQDQDWRSEQVDAGDGFAEEIRHFLGAARGEHDLAITVEDGVRSMEVICRAYDHAEDHI